MDSNPEGQPSLRKVRQAFVAGIGALALDGAVFAWDMQDKINDIAIIYHVPLVLSGMTLVTAAGLRWREIRHS